MTRSSEFNADDILAGGADRGIADMLFGALGGFGGAGAGSGAGAASGAAGAVGADGSGGDGAQSASANRTEGTHLVLGTPYGGPWPAGYEAIIVAAGCFWGVEKLLWEAPGVWTTLPGYVGGHAVDPTYRQVCGAGTGHTEGVLAVYDPARTSFGELLRLILENHDPTQGDRQGNDIGPQYRSGVYPLTDAQERETREVIEAYGPRLAEAGYGPITTEVVPLKDTPTGKFWVAEPYHRGYLEANPNGYCPVHATGGKVPGLLVGLVRDLVGVRGGLVGNAVGRGVAAEALAGLLLGAVDLVGVLAAGALVDLVADLLDGLADLVRVLGCEVLGLVDEAHLVPSWPGPGSGESLIGSVQV